MKRVISRNSLTLLAILLLILGNARSSRGIYETAQIEVRVLAESCFESFQEGDIILRKGDSWLSGFIARALPNPYKISHGGILMKSEGKWLVIHTISGQISNIDGIRSEPLERFLEKASGAVVLLLSPRFDVDRKELTARAKYYLQQKTPFDMDYDLNTHDKLYCTELIRAVYLDAGAEDIFSSQKVGNKTILDFSGFFDERYWEMTPLFLDKKSPF